MKTVSQFLFWATVSVVLSFLLSWYVDFYFTKTDPSYIKDKVRYENNKPVYRDS